MKRYLFLSAWLFVLSFSLSSCLSDDEPIAPSPVTAEQGVAGTHWLYSEQNDDRGFVIEFTTLLSFSKTECTMSQTLIEDGNVSDYYEDTFPYEFDGETIRFTILYSGEGYQEVEMRLHNEGSQLIWYEDGRIEAVFIQK